MIRAALFASYSLLAHLAVILRAPVLQAAGLTLLCVAVLYRQLRERPTAWATLAAFIAAACGLIYAGGGRYVAFAPSLILTALAGYSFFSSLRPGRTPLITRMTARVYDPLPPDVAAYTRGLTWFWALVISAIFAINLYLMADAPADRWSAFANGYVYLILGSVFVLEYAWRRLRFRGSAQPGAMDYLRLLLRQSA